MSNQIYELIPKIMAEIGHIGKDQKNKTQGFMFRGIDDVYNSMHPLLAKHGVFTVPKVLETHHEERTSKSGGALIYRIFTIQYTFYAPDGSSVEAVVVGEGMDSGDKAGNKAMAIAHKYAFLQVFAIPTANNDDPDKETHEVKPRSTKQSSPPQSPVSQPEGNPDSPTEKQKSFLNSKMKKSGVEDRKGFYNFVLSNSDDGETRRWISDFLDQYDGYFQTYQDSIADKIA